MDFIRFETLIGKDNFDYLKNMRIVIVGIGGVGGYALESLVRCGIENFLIIDYDKVDVSNKNRQIIADDDSIGKLKTKVFKDRINKINKSCKVDIENIFLNEDNLNIILDYKPDYVIDACDSLNTKKAIIDLCVKNNIKFITSMGTGKRMDASKLEITTLNKTSYDPIAKILRKYVKDNKINKKINVLFSREIPKKIDCDFIPSCSYVPSTSGLLITSFVINDLLSNKE